jgi:tartrate-resistant acid phosphatase type 5
MIRGRLGVLALAVALGCGRAQPLSIAVIGDFGSGDPAEAQVAAQVAGWRPDLVLTVGDNNYPDGAAETIDRNIGRDYGAFIAPYHGAFGPGATENRFFPALGNHDWRTAGARPYLDYFELPGNERYYELARGGVHLFFLDSDPREPDGITRDSAQARWLRDALARSTEQHRWVLFHHPPYSSGPHGSTVELQWPFRAWGATAVFSGHDHDYERLEVGGMPYVVVGTGGKHLYAFREPVAGSQVRIAGRHGALHIEVTRASVEAEFASTSDAARDRFVLPPARSLPVPVSLVAAGSVWKIRDALEPPAGWLAPGFDTTAWAAAGTPFRIVDRGAAAGAPPRTTYYRVEFEVTAPESLGSLELGVPRDQPAVAFLNGREVARLERDPRREGKWLVPRGPRAGPGTAPILVHRWLDPGVLVAGTNVLAVEVHRVPAEGGDPSFDAELVAYPRTPR